MKPSRLIGISVGITLTAACSSTPPTPSGPDYSNIPSWVTSPKIEGGIAAADCVKFSGNMSIDQKMSAANARVALAQQINTRVEALEKSYQSRNDIDNATEVGTSFTSVSTQVTNESLSGARVERAEIVNIAGTDNFCTLMALTPSATDDLLNQIVDSSGRKLSTKEQRKLEQAFKVEQAEVDLEEAIKRITQ